MNLLDNYNRIIESIRKLFKTVFSGVQIKSRQQFFVFLFFLFLSMLLWLLKTLYNDNYVTTVNYPVTYNNFPADKVLVSELPKKLRIEIRGVGYTLIKYKIKPKIKGANFDVNSFSLNQLENKTQAFYTLTRYTRQALLEKFKHEVEIINIQPDTLKFIFSDKVSKKVPVNIKIDATPEKTYMFTGYITANPDTVTVFGPENIIDTLKAVDTEYEVYTNLTDSLSNEIDLVEYKYLTIEPNETNVTIPIDKATESEIRIPIDLANVPDSISVKIFPSEVNVIFKVPLAKLDFINIKDFKAVVNFQAAQQGLTSRLKINLTKQPVFIENVVLSRTSVEYLIEKQ